MLHLQPGVHLHEIEGGVVPPALGDEFDRTRTRVTDGFRGIDRGFQQPPAQGFFHRRARRLFDDLLVPALD